MKYSYEYKKQCVELYRQGKWPETPVGVKQKNFHKTIRKWARMEEACGPEVLHHKSQNKVWTAEEKYELVVWGDRIFEKCGIRRDEEGDGGKTLEIRGKRRLSARDGGANYQQS
ncbi:MAG: hypothetical protein ACLSBO_11625 [Akkermansia muciniphila]